MARDPALRDGKLTYIDGVRESADPDVVRGVALASHDGMAQPLARRAG